MLESLKDELEMTIEGDVTSFLGIEFKHLPSGAVQTLQLGLIERVLNTTGMQACNPDCMPASQKLLEQTRMNLNLQNHEVTHLSLACCCIWW